MTFARGLALALTITACAAGTLDRVAASAVVPVEVVRLPSGGVQPDVAVDARGVLHVVYLAGEAPASDVFYTRSSDGGRTFDAPVRVNSVPGSAIAVGTIRGAQLALGRDGRVHIVWNGSSLATPESAGSPSAAGRSPLLYSRSTAGRPLSFEPQRNLITRTRHLDGGSAVAADASGRVFVAWHGNASDGADGEQSRRVWIGRSDDDGATFAVEMPISPEETGVCGCCSLSLAIAGPRVHVVYRGAREQIHRDIHALDSTDGGRSFTARRLDTWEIGACPMSSMDVVLTGSSGLVGWERDGQVVLATGPDEGHVSPPAPDAPESRRKHPRIALAPDGPMLLAWAEGTGWKRGGAVGWQAFLGGRALMSPVRREGLPVWGSPAVAYVADRFVILY